MQEKHDENKTINKSYHFVYASLKLIFTLRLLTVSEQINHSDCIKQWMPIKLHARIRWPAQSVQVAEDPCYHQNDNRQSNQLCGGKKKTEIRQSCRTFWILWTARLHCYYSYEMFDFGNEIIFNVNKKYYFENDY